MDAMDKDLSSERGRPSESTSSEFEEGIYGITSICNRGRIAIFFDNIMTIHYNTTFDICIHTMNNS
jgi:hypothetical protein